MSILLGALATTATMFIARGIGRVIQNIGERVFPVEETRAYKLAERRRETEFDLENKREGFQMEVLERQLENNRQSLEQQLESNKRLQLELEEKKENFQVAVLTHQLESQLELENRRENFQIEVLQRQLENNRKNLELQLESNRKLQLELEEKRENFQVEVLTRQIESNRQNLELQLKSSREIAEKQLKNNMEIAVFNRETQYRTAQYNVYHNLRHVLLQDAIRNFPLNISPLVLLENNNIDIQFLLGDDNNQDREKEIKDKIKDGVNATKPLSVFITPMHIDSRVNGKEVIAAQIFDNIYSSVESLFVNEYSRNSERPIYYYSAAWNKGVNGGLHAAEELYYFLKDLPTIVVEPRFDGRKLKIMFSCWGLGYSSRMHFRQEIPIDIDLNSILATSVYERSKQALETYNSVATNNKYVQEQINRCKHNVEMFEKLDLEKRLTKRFDELKKQGYSTELDELGNYSNFFYTEGSDVSIISNLVSSTIGIIVACMADTHHLLSSDIIPKLPHIYRSYFGNCVNNELLDEISDMYERTFLKLCKEFPRQKYLRLIENASTKKLLGAVSDDEDIKDSLKQKCGAIGVDKNAMHNWSVSELIDFYIANYDGDEQYVTYLIHFMSEEQHDNLNVKLLNLRKYGINNN